MSTHQISPATALANMTENDPRFKRTLGCNDDPPPPYTSVESTQLPSPKSFNSGQHEAVEMIEVYNSMVHWQFDYQKRREMERLSEDNITGHIEFEEVATRAVIKDWTEQGIWNSEWNPQCLTSACWMHEEEPLERDPGSDKDTQAPPPIFGEPQRLQPRAKRDRRTRTRQFKEMSTQEKIEREASRPIHRFNNQVLKEHERISREKGSRAFAGDFDLAAEAHENVKREWLSRGIWDSRWLHLSGTLWKHEQPRVVGPTTCGAYSRNRSSKLLATPIKTISPSEAEILENNDQENGASPLEPTLHYESVQKPRRSDRKAPRNNSLSEPTGRVVRGLMHVAEASKVIQKDKRRRGSRRNGTVQQPLRRSIRIADQAMARSSPAQAAECAEHIESKHRVAGSLTRTPAIPRGVSKRPSKPTRQRGKGQSASLRLAFDRR